MQAIAGGVEGGDQRSSRRHVRVGPGVRGTRTCVVDGHLGHLAAGLVEDEVGHRLVAVRGDVAGGDRRHGSLADAVAIGVVLVAYHPLRAVERTDPALRVVGILVHPIVDHVSCRVVYAVVRPRPGPAGKAVRQLWRSRHVVVGRLVGRWACQVRCARRRLAERPVGGGEGSVRDDLIRPIAEAIVAPAGGIAIVGSAGRRAGGKPVEVVVVVNPVPHHRVVEVLDVAVCLIPTSPGRVGDAIAIDRDRHDIGAAGESSARRRRSASATHSSGR